ncbi:MAG: flagellar basal body L-ring protein FlgH [bacterium]
MIDKRKWCLIAVLLFAAMLPVTTSAQMMKEIVARSFYADKKAFNEGDIITVQIVEFAQGTNQTNAQTNSDNRLDANADPSGLGWIPNFGLTSQMTNRHTAEGEITTKGSLESKMTAVVTEVQENGLLSIQGTRTVDVNGERQTTVLTGLVRPEDVSSDNMVYSYNIANAQISYKGKGLVTEAGKPGIVARIWNWIF